LATWSRTRRVGAQSPLGVPALGLGGGVGRGGAGGLDDPNVLEQTSVGAVARAAEAQADGAAGDRGRFLSSALANESAVDLEPEAGAAAAELDVVPGLGGRDVLGLGEENVAGLAPDEGVRLMEAGMEGSHIIGDGARREEAHGAVDRAGRAAGPPESLSETAIMMTLTPLD